MATALNTRSLAWRSFLFGCSTVEVHYREGADVGYAFFFEERVCLQWLGVVDQVRYRKRSRLHLYLESMAGEWGLSSAEFAHGADSDISLRTTVLGSRMLFVWVLQKFRDSGVSHDQERQQKCSIAFLSMAAVAARGAGLLPSPASVTVGGITLTDSVTQRRH